MLQNEYYSKKSNNGRIIADRFYWFSMYILVVVLLEVFISLEILSTACCSTC
jgi:hypothetical protein